MYNRNIKQNQIRIALITTFVCLNIFKEIFINSFAHSVSSFFHFLLFFINSKMSGIQYRGIVNRNLAEFKIFIQELNETELLTENLTQIKRDLNVRLRYLQHLLERVLNRWIEMTRRFSVDVENIKALRAKIAISKNVEQIKRIIYYAEYIFISLKDL